MTKLEMVLATIAVIEGTALLIIGLNKWAEWSTCKWQEARTRESQAKLAWQQLASIDHGVEILLKNEFRSLKLHSKTLEADQLAFEELYSLLQEIHAILTDHPEGRASHPGSLPWESCKSGE